VVAFPAFVRIGGHRITSLSVRPVGWEVSICVKII
jgi:hypothetical protein